MNDPTVGRRAPISHYVAAIAFGAVATIAVALIVGASNLTDFWLAAGIGALCTAYPAVSLGVRFFVTDHTVTRDTRGDESVELAWMRRAAAGAFLDLLVTALIATLVLLVFPIDLPASSAVLALAGVAAVDVTLRYLVIRHRALK